jgi:hypothetical protein
VTLIHFQVVFRFLKQFFLVRERVELAQQHLRGREALLQSAPLSEVFINNERPNLLPAFIFRLEKFQDLAHDFCSFVERKKV